VEGLTCEKGGRNSAGLGSHLFLRVGADGRGRRRRGAPGRTLRIAAGDMIVFGGYEQDRDAIGAIIELSTRPTTISWCSS